MTTNNDELKQLSVQLKELNSTIDHLEKQLDHTQPHTNCPHITAAPYQPVIQLCAAPEPLLQSGNGQYNSEIIANLGPLAYLIGTWANTNHYGFNVMPIPQATAPNGFILKNFPYYEEITFSAIADGVANRGGTFQQNAYTLFYEQRVFFLDGPQANSLVHAENGSWLHLIKGQQLQGPIGTTPIPTPPAPNPIPIQDPTSTIVKQVSVPHGNSILATGAASTTLGAPRIPVVNTLPIDAPEAFFAPYGTNIPTNPEINPNIVLQQALAYTPEISRTHSIYVDSNHHGDVTNIPFIRKYANVSRFSNNLWLEELVTQQMQMQYSQNITLEFPQPDGSIIQFPHIVANTMTKIR